jgi:predicted transposase YbfD/YdcC
MELQQVDKKSNEITAIPLVLKEFAQKGVVFAFDALNTQKKLVGRSSSQAITT